MFKRISGFCPDCGSILPLLRGKGGVTCFTCTRSFLGDLYNGKRSKYAHYFIVHVNFTVFGSTPVKYTILFNSQDGKKKAKVKPEDQEEGSVVERKCPQCGNEKMSYATLQLRSADEGQTVFYTCTKCSFKESENS